MSSSLKKVPGLLTLGIAMVMSVQFILLSALDVLSSSDHRSSLQLKRLLPLQTTRTDGTTLNATRFRPANSSFNSLQANTTSLEESASASACLLVCDDNHFLIGALEKRDTGTIFTWSTVHRWIRFSFSECLTLIISSTPLQNGSHIIIT
jgi:hypothetical protein